MSIVADTLPWTALSLPDERIPWDDLRTLADAAVESAEVRKRLATELTEHLDRRYGGDDSSYGDMVDLAVPTVFALAADRLDDGAREEVADLLVDVLDRAGREDDEFLLEVIGQTAGRLGPAIVAPILRLLQAHNQDPPSYPFAISLLRTAAKADRSTRVAVAKTCAARLTHRSMFDEPTAETLAMLDEVEPLEEMPELRGAFEPGELAALLEGHQANDAARDPSETTSLEAWVAQKHREALGYLAREPEHEEDDPWRLRSPRYPVRRDAPRIGRNDPCPCGSGRKYKKCCLR